MLSHPQMASEINLLIAHTYEPYHMNNSPQLVRMPKMTSLPWFLDVLVRSGMGFCSGLFDLGGSSIDTPIFRLLGLPALIALASPLPLTLPSAIGGAIAYRKTHLIHWRIAVSASLWGIPGVLAAGWLTEFLPGVVLMILTAVFILGVGAYGLSGLRNRELPKVKPLYPSFTK